jgi:hypothetical protein
VVVLGKMGRERRKGRCGVVMWWCWVRWGRERRKGRCGVVVWCDGVG